MKKLIVIICVSIVSVFMHADTLNSILNRYDYYRTMHEKHIRVLHTVYSADFSNILNGYTARVSTDDYMDSLHITTVYYFTDSKDSLITRSVIRKDNPAASYMYGRKTAGLLFSSNNIYRGHDIESLIDSTAQISVNDSIITIINENNTVDSLFIDTDTYLPLRIVMSDEGDVFTAIMSDYHIITDYLRIPGSLAIYMDDQLIGRCVLEDTETEFNNE